ESARKRLELAGPVPVGVSGRFQMQVEQPRPAIGPLEPCRERPGQISALHGNFFGGECAVREALDLEGFGAIAIQPPNRQQRPPAVNATMPVETAEEDGVKLSRWPCILVAAKHVIELVRIFLRD